MISELLEESGIDREHLQRARRQVLQGIVLLCQWQLSRMDQAPAAPEEAPEGEKRAGRRRGRAIKVE
jgi:hypothetical protein